jgi:hypothetical protein
MTDSEGQITGHVCIVNDGGLPSDRSYLARLAFVTAWASAELQRQKVLNYLSASERRFRGFAASSADWF